MKKLYIKILTVSLIALMNIMPISALALIPLPVNQGGTGVNTITGIIQGSGTSAFSPITVGTGLSFVGGTLSATGSGTITGSGVSGQSTFWSGTSAIAGDTNYLWDNTAKKLTIGSATTGGQAATILNGGVLSGSSASDNFFNLTGTFPTVNTTTTTGVSIFVSGAGSSSFGQNAGTITLGAGYTGSSGTNGVLLVNTSAGTGVGGIATQSANNYGFQARVNGQGTGNNIGTFGNATRSSTLNAGAVGIANTATNSPALNIGSAGFALNATTNVAGFFGLLASNPTLGTSSALIADNGAVAADIFEARDNGTPVFSIKDAGHVLVEGVTSTGATGTGKFVFDTSPTITGGTLTTSTINGVTLTTGGGTSTFLNANGTYSTPTGGSGTVTSVASADGSITVTNPTTTVDLAVVKAPILSTARTIGGVSFDGSANITVATATGGFTVSGGNLTLSTNNLVTDTTTGTKIGTATNQKLGFFNATPIVQPSGDVATALSNLGLITSPTIVATTITSRTLWGQTYDGSGNVTGSLTSVGNITGGASSMTIVAGTGASRTLTFQTTTAGSTATTALTLAADQSATFANTVNATTFVGALTGNASTATKWATARNLAGNSVDGSGNVAFANKFIVQGTTDTGLSGAQFLGALSTGLVKNTTTTGILSIASAGTDYEVPLTFSTGLTRTTNTITVNTSQNIATLSNLTSNGLVTTSGSAGTLSITAMGTGVATALGVNVGSAGAFVTFNGALGTPSSGTATNLTGTATGLTSGSSNALQSASTTVNTSSATAPTAGQNLIATDSTHATWQTPYSFQDIGTSTVSAIFSGITSTSTTDGSVMYMTPQGGTAVIYRFAKDAVTGTYLETHHVSSTIGRAVGESLVVIGSFLYFVTSSGTNIVIDRYSASDLTGETSMTVPTVAVTNVVAWSDGTALYLISSSTATTSRKWTVSGTTFTASTTATCDGTIVGFLNSGSVYDGTTVYVSSFSGQTATILKLSDINGTAITSTTTKTVPLLSSAQGGAFIFPINSLAMYLGVPYSEFNATVVDGIRIYLAPITKP